MDKVKRDGDDITYLNRVVAEILGEMKTIHGDLDLLRTLNANNQGTEAERKPSVQDGERGTNVAADSGLVEDLANRLASLEERLDTVNHSSEFRDKGLQDEIDDCRRGLRAAARLTDEDVDLLKGLPGLQERLSKVEERAEANENTQESLNEKLTHVLESLNNAGGADGDSGVHPAQFGMLQGTVSALEKQLAELQGKEDKDWTAEIDRLTRAIGELREEASKLGQQVRRTETECERLEDAKENKGARGSIVGSTAVGGNNDDLLQRVLALSSAHDSLTNTVREKTAYLDETKADRTAVQRLGDELHNIKKLMELNSQREAAASGQGDEKVSAANEELIQELQRQLLRQSESTNKGNDMTMDEVERLREMIQQLDYRKADATLVANKAERDYVENALERLMREVEQVLNATNAGLIDTLDKSLNILRDMIDGKATKQDIQRLQLLASRDGASGASPDGLTGFKGYRCLGCNRPMENLRPRSLPSKMDTFLNRTPQNYPQDNVTRSIQQQQQGTALLEQRAASYHSGTKGGRSGTPPLPPIEGPK
ncbi:hypothetical protein, conserved [Angomonas deanei]|uniref:Uncharacterized protein n=1 Tax=Angomonas deanei TaxID=59799 RepID=A0A7G2CJ20_9TRYP|nr:hypothetical protein, conserved [Angomonas deanei]